MRTVLVLFDSLNRRFLPPYSADWVHAPNFTRLAAHTVRFDNCYGGSMPCMPARREMHTGRHNFLHRSWGPLEPFDDSVPELLSAAGVYSHLVTDHPHYWEDGGATYHSRFRTFEFFRGQEGDAWKGQVADPPQPQSPRRVRNQLWRQDLVNRQYLTEPADHPQIRTVHAGLEFLRTNHAEDAWFLQIECFDPHEPYFSHREFQRHYPALDAAGQSPAWPDYKRVAEDPETVDRARAEYAALLTMCDASLGRVLDVFDELDLWDDTLLIVCTDHGFLLGEHGWWGKNVQPWYDENIHTPLFVWDPVARTKAGTCRELVQTIDFGPTLLDFFGLQPTADMQGRSLLALLRDPVPGKHRAGALFGIFGGHVNVTDGRYVYLRAPAAPGNAPLFEHTLMPTHMASRFTPAELENAQLVGPLPFTKNVPVLRVPGFAVGDPFDFGTALFDLESDPRQANPMIDDDLELRMIDLLLELMRANNAPDSQFTRLGLPVEGPADSRHLLARTQLRAYQEAVAPLPIPADFPTGRPGVNTPITELLATAGARAIVEAALGPAITRIAEQTSSVTLLDLADFTPVLTRRTLHQLDRALAES
ncbi:sulfatase-like hydrolase/transferase [Nocardia sp. CA-128927]|uniref:sulfatase-like hydrolase/transferase n=1 Tax=Nocardia sp. CA-128927 TaxID=3239975 RepID=UPI003D991C9B